MRKRPEVVSAASLIAIAAALLSVSVVTVMLLAAGLSPGWGSQPAQAATSSIDLVALDMDTTGNTVAAAPSGNVEQTTLGTIDNCISVTHPATFDVDFIVQGYPPDPDPGPPITRSLVGYDVNVTFPAGLQLKDTNTGNVTPFLVQFFGRTLVSGDPQSGSFFATIDLPNFTTGSPLVGPATHSATVLDFAAADPDENIDGEENSDGFLVRYTFETTAAVGAVLDLTLSSNSSLVLHDGGGVPITVVAGGKVAVDMSCPVLFAEDDAVTVAEDSGATAIDVLFNDGDGGAPPTPPKTIIAVTDPLNGTAAVNGDDIDYTPDLDFNGSDSFNYTIKNNEGATDTATVTVTVTPVADAPVAVLVNITVDQNSGVNSWVPDVSDADGDPLKCLTSDAPEHGIVTVEEDCTSGTYRPRTGFSGSDSFTYQVLELVDVPHDSVKGTVNVTVVAPTSASTPTPTPGPGATSTSTSTPTHDPTDVAGATAAPTAAAAVLPGTGDGISLGGGGSSGLTFLVIGLILLIVAPGTVAVGVILRRRATLGR